MSRLADASMFLSLAVMWGLSFPAIAIGLEHLPPLLFAAFRYDVAAVLLLAYAAVRIEEWLPRDRADLLAVAGGGLFMVASNGFLFVAQQTVASGVAAMMQALIPIVTSVWALLLLGERLSPVGAAGVAVGFAGTGLIVQPDPAALLSGDTVGRLLILVEVACIAFGGVLVQRAGAAIDRVSLTAWSMVVGALTLHAVSLGIREVPGGVAIAPAPTAVGAILYLSVFSTALAYVLYFGIIEQQGAFEASLVAYAVPIVATVVGVVFLDESIGLLTVAGFCLVAVGFAVLKRGAIAEATGLTAGVGGA